MNYLFQFFKDIMEPFLIGKYERLKEDINIIYKDVFVSDLQDNNTYELSNFFSELLQSSVKPVNKLLTFIFIKNNLKKI
jgi:hypothetical protein